MNELNSDIIIAGAGPAGATTSLFLCKEKIPHIIIDKAVFPRDKICGDALSGKVADVLKKLNPSYLHELSNDQKNSLGSYGVKFAAPNGNFVDIPFKENYKSLPAAPGFIERRIDFDNWLVNKIDRSYATFVTASLKDVRQKENHAEITYDENGNTKTATCRLLIGSEGSRSLVAKKLASISKEDNHYCAGLRAYYSGVTGMHPDNFIELHFLKDLLPGYLWIFPLADGNANVGVGMLSSHVSKRHINLKKVMLNSIETNPTIKHRFTNAKMIGDISGWGLPLGSKKRKISGNNFLLTGDAASLIDPFTGEGIGNAMFSGMIAAQHIKNALAQKSFDEKFLSAYTDEIYDKLWKELRLSRTLQQLSNNAWLFNLVVNKASKNKRLRNTIMNMFDDVESRSRLSNPFNYLKLLFR